MRYRVLAAALAACAAVAGGAAAEPFAGKVHTATGMFGIRGRDGVVYRVTTTLQISKPASGTPRADLQIALARCGPDACGAATTYLVPVTSAQIADDFTSASVRGTFAGRPIDLRWTGGTAAPCCNGDVKVNNTDVYVREPGGGESGFGGSLLGVRCFGDGTITGAAGASSNGAPVLSGRKAPAQTPPAFTTAGRKGPSCIKG